MAAVAEANRPGPLVKRIDSIVRVAIEWVGNLRPKHPIPRQVCDLALNEVRILVGDCLALVVAERLLHTKLEGIAEQWRTCESNLQARSTVGRAQELTGHRLRGAGPNRVRIDSVDRRFPVIARSPWCHAKP